MFHVSSMLHITRRIQSPLARCLCASLLSGAWREMRCLKSFLPIRNPVSLINHTGSVASWNVQKKWVQIVFLLTRLFSTAPKVQKLVSDMSNSELIALFSNPSSNRMELVKAGERLFQQSSPLSERVATYITHYTIGTELDSSAFSSKSLL